MGTWQRYIKNEKNEEKELNTFERFQKNNPELSQSRYEPSQMDYSGAKKRQTEQEDAVRSLAVDKLIQESNKNVVGPATRKDVSIPFLGIKIQNGDHFREDNLTKATPIREVGYSPKVTSYTTSVADRLKSQIEGTPTNESAIDQALAMYNKQRKNDMEAYFADKDISEKPVSQMSNEEKQAVKDEFENIPNYNFFETRSDMEKNDATARKQKLYPNYREVKNQDAYEALKLHGMTDEEIQMLNGNPLSTEEIGQLKMQGKTDDEINRLAEERSVQMANARKKYESLIASVDDTWGVSVDDITNMMEDKYANPEVQKMALESPVSSSLYSLGANPFTSAAEVGANVYNYATGRPMQNYQTGTELIRNAITENINNDFGKTAYGGAMSIGDMVVSSGLAYATGGGSIVNAGIQALEKAAQTMGEGADRGLTPDQIFAEGIASGVTTYVTEKIPMGIIQNVAEKGLTSYTAKELGKHLGSMFLSEGLQEAYEDVADWAADAVIAWDKNEFNVEVQNLISQGMSPEDAALKVISNRFKEALTDFTIGGLGGGTVGGGTAAFAYGLGKINSNPSVQTDKITNESDALDILMNAGKTLDYKAFTDEDAERVKHAYDIANKPKNEVTQEDIVDLSNVLNEQANEENNYAEAINNANYVASMEQNISEYENTGKISEKENELPIEQMARKEAESLVVKNEKEVLKAQKQIEKLQKDYENNGLKSKIGKNLTQFAENFENETAAKNFLDNYKGQNPSMYATVSLQAYNAGESGQDFNTYINNSTEADYMLKSGEVTEAYLKTIFYNGQNARVEEKGQTNIAKNVNRGTYKPIEKDETTEFFELLAKKLNAEIIESDDTDFRGRLDDRITQIVISRFADNKLTAGLHEAAGEYMGAYNKQGMERVSKVLTDYIVNRAGESGFVDVVNRYKEAYRSQGRKSNNAEMMAEANKTFSEAQEEFINDAISYILTTEEGFKNLAAYVKEDNNTSAKEKVSFFQAIKEWLDNLIKTIKGYMAKNKSEQLGNKYMESLKIASEDLEKLSRLIIGELDEARANLAAATEKITENSKNSEVKHSYEVKEESENKNANVPKSIEITKAELNENLHKAHNMDAIGPVEFYDFVKKGLGDGAKELMDHVSENGKTYVDVDGLGRVDIDVNGLKDILLHGKAEISGSLVDAIIPVLEKGKVVYADYNHKNKNYNTATIVAPVKFSNNGYGKNVAGTYYVGIIVKRSPSKDVLNQNLHVADILTIRKGLSDNGHTINSMIPYATDLSLNDILNYVAADVNIFGDEGTIKFSLNVPATDSEGRKLSKGQKEYFANSKVVDENGNLLRVYHGSMANFTIFDMKEARDSADIEAFFFSHDKDEANGYGNIREFYLNITNPADRDTAYNIFFEERKKKAEHAGTRTRERLIELGYDGVIAEDEDSPEYTEYLAFYPEQIKLVSNTKPTKNEDIRYSFAVHAGDLGKAEGFWNMVSSNRGTGHFGTGTYFVGDEEQINQYGYEKRPHEKVDFDNYNLFKPKNYKEGMALHEALKFINNSVYDYEVLKDLDNIEKDLAWLDVYGMNLYHETDMDKAVDGLNKLYDKYGKYLSNYEKNRLGDREDYKDETDFLMNFSDYGEEIREGLEDLQERFDKSVSDLANVLGISEDKARQQMLDVLEECSKIEDAYHEARYADSPSTRFMKAFGYEGIDVRDIKQMDNVEYGSVIYDLKGKDLERKNEIGTARYSLPVTDSTGRTLSEGQRKYFAKSLIRDENGNLKVMYHGTERGGFTIFNPEFSDDGISLFFTDDKNIAKAYSGTDKEIKLYKTVEDLEEMINDSYTHIEKYGDTYKILYGYDNAKVEFEGTFDELKEYVEEWYGVVGATNYKVYLNAENPLIVDAKGNNWDEIPEVIKGLTTTREYAKYAKDNGYDSVIINNVVDSGVNADSNSRYKNTQVVIVFNSNQVKSVDNLNPTKNEDIRHSFSVSGDDFFDSFMEVDEEVKKTESQLKDLLENRLDLDSDMSKKMISDVASNILKKYNSTYKKSLFEKSISSVFKYLQNNNATMDDILMIMSDITKPMLEQTKNVDPELEKLYNDFVSKVKTYNISLDAGQMQEVANSYGTYKNFVDSMRGKLSISKKGVPLDNVWTEICDASGGMLSYGTNPNDQPMALANLIESLNPAYSSLEGQALEDASMDAALEIIRQFYVQNALTGAAETVQGELTKRANKFKNEYKQRYNEALKKVEAEKQLNIKRLAEEIDNLTAEEQEAIRNGDTINKALIENERQKYIKRLERLRAESNQRIARAQAKYRNAWIDKNLKRQRTELKNRVLREVKALQNLIAHPSEGATKHVPVNLIKPTIEMLEAINLDNGGRNKAIAERLKKMSEVYESFKNDERYSFDYDERIARDIEELRELFEGKSYADLEITELERVIEIVTALKTQIKNANNLILQGKYKDAQEAASNAMTDVRMSRRYDNAAMNVLNRYANNHLNAYREFRKLSGYGDGVLMDIYNNLDEGSHREMQIQKDLGEIFRDVLEGQKNQKEVKKFISTKKEDLVDIGITDKNGKPILITKAMRMSLIMHSMNAGNMRHVLGSGITIPNMYYFEKGKLDEAYAKGTNYRFVNYQELLEAIQKNDTNKIEELSTQAQQRIESLRDDLSDWEKDFLADAEKMFHDETGKLINDTSMALKGYAIARVKNYFPIKTDSHFTTQDWSGLVQNGSLEGSGVLKERVVSTKPILLEDITNVIERQIRFTSKYAGLAIAVRNFDTLMKQTSRDQVTGELHNLYETIDSVWGASDTKWLKNLMQDIQGGRNEGRSWLMNLRGQFAGATLTLNPSVAIKQAASYPTAAAVVGWKALGRAAADIGKGFGGKGLAELEKINPLLWYRMQGFGTQEVADAKAVGFGKNLPQWAQKAINWTQWFDTGTVRTLEYAAKYYVDDNFKNLKEGSEEYWQKVSEVFTNIVEQTQPNYSTLHKADIIRNPNSFVKMLVMFKTQPMQNFGIIYDAMGELNAAKISGNKKWIDEASSKAARAISSQVVSATVFSAMTILSQLLLHRWWKYRDDEGNWSWEKFWVALGEGALSCVTGAFLGGSELYEALKHIFTGETYYGIEVSVAEMVNDLVDNIGNLSKNTKALWNANTSEERETAVQKILKYSINLGSTAGEFGGTPVNNIKNMIASIYFYATDIVRSIDEGELSFSDDSNLATWEIETQYERIYQALQNNDVKKYEKLVNELKDKAKEENPDLTEDEITAKVEENVTKKITSMMKEEYLEGNISEEEMSTYLQEEKGKTEDEAYFQMREWQTGESTYGVMKNTISTAAADPTPENRKAVIEEIENLLAHGKDKSGISSTITTTFKAEYIQLYNKGKAADLNAILRAALVEAGYTDEEAKKKLNDWLK